MKHSKDLSVLDCTKAAAPGSETWTQHEAGKLQRNLAHADCFQCCGSNAHRLFPELAKPTAQRLLSARAADFTLSINSEGFDVALAAAALPVLC